MILPTKTLKPVDSLFCISSYILKDLRHQELTLDDILQRLNQSYPKEISIETVLLCLNYLFIVGQIESDHEIIKIKC